MSTYHTVRVAGNTAHELSASGVKQVLMSYRGRKLAAVDPDWKPRPGMLYTQVRAISARVNQNFDAWPSDELKKSYRTFLGKPVFVNHNNDDPERARGKVIAARYVEAGDDKYIEVVQEIDAECFPKLAREIREGGLDSVSMGVEAGITKCSYCGNLATDEPEFCDHVKYHKGEYLPRKNTKTGKVEDVLVYETCRKLGFFELSMVFDPADETAVVSRVIAASRGTRRQAYGEPTAPESVDTLRDEDGDTYDDYQFVEPVEEADEPFEHWIDSPDELRAPDLSMTQRLDREQEEEGLDADRRVEDVEDIVSDEADMAQPQQGRQAMARNKNHRTAVEVPDELVEHLSEDLEALESYAGGGDDEYEAMEAMEEALGQDLDGDYEQGEDAEHVEAVMGGGDPMVAMAGRRPVERAASVRNVRKAKKGTTMASSLSSRGKVASRRRHYADDNGHVDGGPYGNDSDQGHQEEVFVSQVPAAEPVDMPNDDESNISNTEQTLVAHRLQREIKARAADLQRYLTAYRRVAECDDNIEKPSEVNPKQSGTDEDLRGDFESLQPEMVTTQPKDASVRVFRAFDNWLQSTTGRTASQHGNANYIRRQAASYSKAAGIPLEKMFPALDVVLRQARKAERSAMNRRRAEFDGDVVAPDARVDVEAPVKNVTDADAQASQYDLGDFGNNAGDDVANPNTETDSQIWAPKEANRKADAVAAVRYAEAYINAGLPCDDKWKLVAQAQTIRHATVVDRTRLLEYVAQTNADRARTQKVAAVVSRGTNNGIPKGLTAPRPTPQRTAAADSADDFGLWF